MCVQHKAMWVSAMGARVKLSREGERSLVEAVEHVTIANANTEGNAGYASR